MPICTQFCNNPSDVHIKHVTVREMVLYRVPKTCVNLQSIFQILLFAVQPPTNYHWNIQKYKRVSLYMHIVLNSAI